MGRILRTFSLILALLSTASLAAMAAPPETDRFIVVLQEGVASPAEAAREIAAQVGGQVGFIYEHRGGRCFR